MWPCLNTDIKIRAFCCLCNYLFGRLNIEFADTTILQKEFCKLISANFVNSIFGNFCGHESNLFFLSFASDLSLSLVATEVKYILVWYGRKKIMATITRRLFVLVICMHAISFLFQSINLFELTVLPIFKAD